MRVLKSKAILLTAVVITSVVIYFFYGLPWNAYKYSKAFEHYLEKTYQSDFEIKNISYDFFHNTYKAEAFEKGNEQLPFYVGQNSSDKKITDGYAYEKTANAAYDTVSSILEKLMPDYKKVNVELVSLDEKALEINIWVKEKAGERIIDEFHRELEAGGYKTDQLFFILDR
ncbi:hypothetical protein [Bacillus marinisedimentorum]|uniref:YfjL-like protein n=1 Tax=Bacillus marinisedimentorum TaxID=1821260 RepID=UPI0008721937|nr:hypothetical protein [Bacillus marinisedimentorum]